MTFTVAVPATVSCTLTAVTVMEVAAVTAGAVKTPEAEIVPPDTDQFTVLLKLPFPMTTTEQGSDAPAAKGLAQVGTTEVTADTGVGAGWLDAGGSVCVPPPQPAANRASSATNFVRMRLDHLCSRGRAILARSNAQINCNSEY